MTQQATPQTFSTKENRITHREAADILALEDMEVDPARIFRPDTRNRNSYAQIPVDIILLLHVWGSQQQGRKLKRYDLKSGALYKRVQGQILGCFLIDRKYILISNYYNFCTYLTLHDMVPQSWL
jgi:hypothetical protein